MAREAHDVSEARRQKGSLYVSSSTTSFENAPSVATTQDALAPSSNGIDRLAIVVVTYKRREMLQDLFASFAALTCAPWRIVIVDNENSPATERIVCAFDEQTRELWGEPEADAEGSTHRGVYAPQTENIGGAGGFSAGTARAFALGAEWFWLMDDDVTVLPDAIEKLARWTDRFDVIQGSRLDFDGGPFYWQYQFITTLGIPNPVAKWDFDERGYKPMNQLCFEGGLFSRRVVEKIGLPDARYFIYGDDAAYGYVASKHFDAAVVADVILKRARAVSNWDIAGKRQLNSTSDATRYYIMRNRGYTARYLRCNGDYHRVLYGIGTAATLAKELIRLVMVDRSFATGIPALIRGMRDARKVYRDRSWKPMPPLAPKRRTAGHVAPVL